MEQLSGFCDLCLSGKVSSKDLTQMLRESVELGYSIVAIEQFYDDIATNSKAKKTDPIPEPLQLDLKEFEGKLKVFHRLTVIFNDNSVSLVLNKSQNLRKYKIVAALPTTDASLQYACQSLNCDLITYNYDTIRLKIARAHYLQAVSREIYFEIKYVPCILDATERRSTIFKARKYRDIGKAKNIIISSGASNFIELRGPYEVANLGWIFGFAPEHSKEAIRAKSHKVIYKGETRRNGSALVFVRKLSKLGVYDSDEISEEEEEEEAKYMEIPEEEINLSDLSDFEFEVEGQEHLEPALKKQKVMEVLQKRRPDLFLDKKVKK